MTTLKVSSTAELITAVPYLIGFHPADSLAVVAVRGRQLAFAVRIDLPELGADPEEARAAILHLATVVANQDVEAVTIIGYGDDERVTPAITRLSEAFERAAIWVIDEVRVADGRYWCYTCPECCPEEGIACEPPDSVLAAEATFAGAVALESRAALEEQVASATGAVRESMMAATARAHLRLARLAEEPAPGARTGEDEARETGEGVVGPAAGTKGRGVGEEEVRPAAGEEGRWVGESAGHQSEGPDDRRAQALARAGREAVREAERRYGSGGRLTDDEVAWLGLALLDLEVRDYAWTRAGRREWEIALWADVTRRVEPAFVPAPASLLAFVAWRLGWGALASIAVERALNQRPDYTMATIISDALMRGTSPEVLKSWPSAPDGPQAGPTPPDKADPDDETTPPGGADPHGGPIAPGEADPHGEPKPPDERDTPADTHRLTETAGPGESDRPGESDWSAETGRRGRAARRVGEADRGGRAGRPNGETQRRGRAARQGGDAGSGTKPGARRRGHKAAGENGSRA